MSYIPGMDALSNPTNFPRDDSVPFDVEQSNGVPTDFGDGFGMNPVSNLYDGAKDYNSGVNATNRPLTQTIMVNSARFGVDAYNHESLVFIHRVNPVNPSLANQMPAEFHVLSLSKFNAFLRSPLGRKLYGGENMVDKLKSEWRFFGSVKRVGKTMFGDDALPVIFGGRARIPDLGRGFAPTTGRNKPHRGIAGQRDHMFLLYRRYNIKNEMDDALNEAGIETSWQVGEEEASSYYWAVDIYLNRNGQQPHPSLYTDEYSNDDKFWGDYEHLGFINFVYGDRMFKTEHVLNARKVIRGEQGFEGSLVALPAVELHLGVH
jgi:hypothetical protein